MLPVSAVGLATDLLQFLDYGCKLLHDSQEIYRSSNGTTTENADLEEVAKNLTSLSDRLRPARTGSGLELASDTNEQGIRDLARSSKVIADDLLSSIQRLKRPGGSHRRWSSIRQALEGMLDKNKIDQLVKRLNNVRSQLSIHILADVRKQQAKTLGSLSKLSSTLGVGLEQQIKSLRADLLRPPKVDEHLTKRGFEEVTESLSMFKSEAKKLAKVQGILESLTFEHIYARELSIVEAYEKTFSWILNPYPFWPASDPRSTIEFRQWLVQEDGIYWITGKPGSGKSTLMKYLSQNAQTRECLKVWAGSSRLAIPAFYFWISGAEMQKSQEGLLRQLLFEILHSFPEPIPAVCHRRWTSGSSTTSWSLSELLETFQRFQEVGAQDSPSWTKLCFFIDGLDEYDGDHFDIIKTVQILSRLNGVKLCVSSRPWNCFEDAFGQNPRRKLYLQDLTKDDIAHYASSKLQESQVSSLFEYNLQTLVEEIVLRADGVFLWVYLVIRSLREGMTNGDGPRLLQERLRELPSDLGEFFKRLITSVDKVYRKGMSATFQVALRTPRPLKLLHYRFLDEDDQETAIDQLLPHLLSASQSKNNSKLLQEEESRIYRQLNGRYKGLLEAPRFPVSTTVEFLHRTVRDYLMDRDMQDLFTSNCGPCFDINIHACKALIAQARVSPEKVTEKDLEGFLFWARNIEISLGANDVRLLDEMSQAYHYSNRLESLDYAFVGKAILSGLVSYIDHVTVRDPSFLRRENGAALKLALFCRSKACFWHCDVSSAIKVLRLLLERGADLNRTIRDGETVLHGFLRLDRFGKLAMFKTVPLESSVDTQFHTQALHLLLSHGANTHGVFHGKGCWFGTILEQLDKLVPGHIRAPEHHDLVVRFFAVFFEHGVDPNMVLRSPSGIGRTMWEIVLGAVVGSQTNHGMAEGLCEGLIEVFLRHGADPWLRFSLLLEDDVLPERAECRYSVREVIIAMFDDKPELQTCLDWAIDQFGRHEHRQLYNVKRKRHANRWNSNYRGEKRRRRTKN